MTNDFTQPDLANLASRYLREQAFAEGAGLGRLESGSEVQLFEAGPVQAIDPRPAWQEAIAVFPFLFPALERIAPPPCWGELVAAQEPAVALAFCAGNYPQLMRDWHVLLHHDKRMDLCPKAGAPLPIALADWIEPLKSPARFPDVLLALGCLRLARQFDAAETLLKALAAKVPDGWRAAWSNESAALAWHKGQHGEALEHWSKQAPTVPVQFNRGMAALFLGDKAKAVDALLQANARLPENSSWHHLGQLYLAFARW